MNSERYADDIPLSLPKRQLPPTSQSPSRSSRIRSRARVAGWHAAIPERPRADDADLLPCCHGMSLPAPPSAEGDRGPPALAGVVTSTPRTRSWEGRSPRKLDPIGSTNQPKGLLR